MNFMPLFEALASNQGALNALLLLREFIVHLPSTVDIVTADSSEKNLKDAFLCTTKCTPDN